MTHYTFTVKMATDQEMRPEILETLVANAMKNLNINVFSGPEITPQSVEVKGKKG